MAPKVVHHHDVGLETGCGYSDVCVIDGHVVLLTWSAGHKHQFCISDCMPNYDRTIAITTSGFEADIVTMYDLRSHILPRTSLWYHWL